MPDEETADDDIHEDESLSDITFPEFEDQENVVDDHLHDESKPEQSDDELIAKEEPIAETVQEPPPEQESPPEPPAEEKEEEVKNTNDSVIEDLAENQENSLFEPLEQPEASLPPADESFDTIFDEEERTKNGLAEINFDIIDTGRWLLKVISGPNNGAEFSMHADGSYVIGTDPNSCDIIFHDTSVSRQQARISVGADDSLTIEDLKSRNGTLVDGESIKTKTKLSPNAVVTIGTTAFTVYDREGEMQTIISPLLPAIVKTLQQEETPSEPTVSKPAITEGTKEELVAAEPIKEEPKHDKHAHSMAAYIAIGIITGLFVIIGLGTATLFKSEPAKVQQEVDSKAMLTSALSSHPNIKYFFNKSNGVLQLTGHVLTSSDKNQILYSLQGMNFIHDIDSTGLIIDEYVWQEMNQALSKNPNWKGITVYSSSPGKFVVSGSLQTRKQSSELSDYLLANFLYLDRLENRVVVEEDVINKANNILQTAGFRNVAVQISDNEITITGNVPKLQREELAKAVDDIKKIEGIRGVKNYVTEASAAEGIVNISDKYVVSGFSRRGDTFSVVIGGLILTKGDELDGMLITEIRQNMILLEKDGVHYRIDFSR